MDALTENIKTLKKSVEKLEEHYVDLSNVNLVSTIIYLYFIIYMSTCPKKNDMY